MIEYGPGRFGGEVFFVPGGGPAEDDGYLLGFVHDEATSITELQVFDAKTMSDKVGSQCWMSRGLGAPGLIDFEHASPDASSASRTVQATKAVNVDSVAASHQLIPHSAAAAGGAGADATARALRLPLLVDLGAAAAGAGQIRCGFEGGACRRGDHRARGPDAPQCLFLLWQELQLKVAEVPEVCARCRKHRR